MRAGPANILANMALALASCLGGLVLCEAALRFFHPKYEDLAAEALVRDPNLLAVRIPNHRGVRRHPDTDALHTLFYNNFGARQHRNFSVEELGRSVNIGYFGDSFTENAGLRAPFSFTEPLDHLLNLTREGPRPGNGEEAGRERFNVLNFGVAAYGTAQSLLRYEGWRHRETLDHVFYLYCENDPGDNVRAALFHLDEAGRLARRRLPGWTAASVGRALVSELHLSYLALDAAGRLSIHFKALVEQVKVHLDQAPETRWLRTGGRPGGDLAADPIPLFRLLLRRFKAAAEASGASFHLVWLPTGNLAGSPVAAVAAEEGVATFNLHECFAEHDPAHPTTPWEESPYRFVGYDRHWNEAGNRLAAVCLHRHLEGVLGLPRRSERQVAAALKRYYSAFDRELAERLQPGPLAAGDEHAVASVAAIQRRYEALEEEGYKPPAAAPGPPRGPWAPSLDKLAARSHFDVYLHEGWLAYVREGCAPADFDARFFLHVVPVQPLDLPPQRLRPRFNNHDFSRPYEGPACTAWQRLPSYPIDRLRTGQFERRGDAYEDLWEVELVLAQGLPAPLRPAAAPR